MTLENAALVTRFGGTVSSVGVYSKFPTVALPTDGTFLHRRFVTTLCPGGADRMRRMMDVVRYGKVDLTPLFTHHMKLADTPAAYDLFRSRRDGVNVSRTHPLLDFARLVAALVAIVLALLVAANIVWTSVHILRRSIDGLMDKALTKEDEMRVLQSLRAYETESVKFHALRTRQAGARKFVAVHVLVPGDWTVQRGHDLLERIENDIRTALPDALVFTHLEPLDDPSAWADEALERADTLPPKSPPSG